MVQGVQVGVRGRVRVNVKAMIRAGRHVSGAHRYGTRPRGCSKGLLEGASRRARTKGREKGERDLYCLSLVAIQSDHI